MAFDGNIPGNKNTRAKGHQAHGYEVFRDVYFSISGGEPMNRFNVSNISQMFNDVYSPNQKESAFNLQSSEKMREQGFFYVPPRLLRGPITVKSDFNLIDEFEITVLADFMTVNNINIRDGRGRLVNVDFAKEPMPYYPLADTILLGSLYAKIKMGYVKNPEQSITSEGMCVGINPTFREDGKPMVTYTFRDVGWDMTRVNLTATYPNLGKNADLAKIGASPKIFKLNKDG